MKIKKIILFLIVAAVFGSCASSRKGSSKLDGGSSPSVRDVTVREEKVTTIDEEDVVYSFYVIVGSFQVVDNARNFRADLTNEGFRPVILESEHGFFRVSVGSFNEERAARNRIAQIRNNYEKYSDVWLLIRKK
jgi:cell division protein FtsN